MQMFLSGNVSQACRLAVLLQFMKKKFCTILAAGRYASHKTQPIRRSYLTPTSNSHWRQSENSCLSYKSSLAKAIYLAAEALQVLLEDYHGDAQRESSGSLEGWRAVCCSADQAWTSWEDGQGMRELSPKDCCEDAAAAETVNWLQVRTRIWMFKKSICPW